jgi:hypothetical protein
MDESNLKERVGYDKSIKFVEPEFETGRIHNNKISNNKLLQGLTSEEGAEKFAAISKDNEWSLFILSFRDINDKNIKGPLKGAISFQHEFHQNDIQMIIYIIHEDILDGFTYAVSREIYTPSHGFLPLQESDPITNRPY